jgi:hypothetical protein
MFEAPILYIETEKCEIFKSSQRKKENCSWERELNGSS